MFSFLNQNFTGKKKESFVFPIPAFYVRLCYQTGRSVIKLIHLIYYNKEV